MRRLAPLLLLLLLAACSAAGEVTEAPRLNGVPILLGGFGAGRR